jgi:hypothetical protein
MDDDIKRPSFWISNIFGNTDENVLPAFDADTDALRKSLKARNQEV